MKSMQTFFVAGILALSTACAGAQDTSQQDISELFGAWRGGIEHQRPDGGVNFIYSRVSLENDEDTGLASGSIGAQAIDLAADLTGIEYGDSVLSFEFNFGSEQAWFEGTANATSITGIVTTASGARALNLERVDPSIDTDRLALQRGLYEFGDGSELLIAPFAWLARVFDFSSLGYRAYMSRSEGELFAGPASFIPAPAQTTLTIGNDGDGAFVRQVSGDVDRVGRRSQLVLEEEIEFTNGDVTLVGLLVRPNSSDVPAPGIVVTWGSGRQDRYGFDALTYFRAVWLARHGFATLIYDKRGVGASTGSYEDRTMELLAGDLAAAVEYIATRPEVDADRVGLLVHSQSGIYAPLTIQMSERVSFAAVIAATIVNGEIQEIVRTEQQLRADGWPEADIANAVETQTLKFHYAATREGWDEYVSALNRVVDRPWFDSVIGSHTNQDDPVWDFWRNGNAFEPAEHWRQVDVPVLYLTGDRDVINPLEQNLAALTDVFSGDRADLLEIRIYEGAEHSLFLAATGSPLEQSELTEMVPYLPDVVDWLAARGIVAGE